MIFEHPNYVPQELIEKIKEAVKPYYGQARLNAYNRQGLSVYISETPELKELDNELFLLFDKIQRDLVKPAFHPQYDSGDSGYEYHLYRAGEFCEPHGDGEFTNSNGDVSRLRYATIVVHLNTVENGGEIVFPNQNKTIKTEAGKVLVFPPYQYYNHYTNPAETDREVLVTWFTYSNFTVLKN